MSKTNNLESVKKSYEARTDSNGVPVQNIANFGLKKGGRASLERGGEYSGFAIEVLENVRPLLTNYTMKFILDNIDNHDKIVKHFYLEKYYVKYREKLIDYIVKIFYEINDIILPKFINKDIKIKDSEIDTWIKTVSHDTINYELKIYGIGKGKKTSVVPEDWIDREFDSGKHLHSEIDKLEWRKNKPPCSFCCVYSMSILDDTLYISELSELGNKIYDVVIIAFDKKKNCLTTTINNLNKKELISKIKINKTQKILLYEQLLIIYDKDIANDKPKYIKSESIGVLASTLQKLVRRGPNNSEIIKNIIKKMNQSKSYTLPEHNFVKISGSRQCLHRCFISIVEDCCGFIKSNGMLNLQDITLLSILCQYDLDIQLSDDIMDMLISTMVEVLNYDKIWDWKNYKEIKKELTIKNYNYVYFTEKYMPLMSGDKSMLNQMVNMLNLGYKLEILKIKKRNYKINKNELHADLYAGYDMHCKPNIILHLQSEMDFIEEKERDKYTTQKLSSFIWENSSKINYRDKKSQNKTKLTKNDILVLENLHTIQKNYYDKEYENKEYQCIHKKYEKFFTKDLSLNIINNKNDTNNTRQIFLLLFGQKIKYDKCEILVCGTNDKPIKVKKYNSKTKQIEFIDGLEDKYIKYIDSLPGKHIKIVKPKLVENFDWIDPLNKLSNFKLTCKKEKNKYRFFVENYEVKPFSCTDIVKSINTYKVSKLQQSNKLYDVVQMGLFNKKAEDNINILFRTLWYTRKEKKNFTVYDWNNLNKKINESVWKKIYCKILIEDVNVVVGPVDRHGQKTYNSIDYTYEGVLLRLFNLLCLLYPDVLEPSGEFSFKLNKKGIGYKHMEQSLKELACGETIIKKGKATIIKTKLWEHQEKSVKKFYDGLVKHNRMGVGDASKVGAGKTLVSVALMSLLHNKNINQNYGGFLVLTPNITLYDTWKNEIEKHTSGFEYILYDGKKLKNNIQRNTIIISTLGRMRDHPINNNWIFVVIDECLSVQNKDALHTEEALRQIISSQYGVLLLSATFFRSRFDKLYYMLKMLRTGLPLDSKYLDTILNETIICNTFDTNRMWYVNEYKLYLTPIQQKKYDNLIEINKKKTDEEKYGILIKFIADNCDYVGYFHDRIKELEKNKKNCKIVIYAKSKQEAEDISTKTIGLYPDISKRHVVGAYSNMTVGVNNLTEFDTILTRPPNADAIPQMKGRLDRPGQKNKNLYLEYIYLDKTIEIAGMYKIAMANSFYDNYILPLSEFYKIALKGKV
jgi:Mimiviridae putative helicase